MGKWRGIAGIRLEFPKKGGLTGVFSLDWGPRNNITIPSFIFSKKESPHYA